MENTEQVFNNRILVIDDNREIHKDFRSILKARKKQSNLDSLETELLEKTLSKSNVPRFIIDSAFQGEEGLKMVEAALAKEKPYALAFVDMHIPPGWDGLETIERIWEVDEKLQVVIFSTYSDYSWLDIFERLGHTDNLLLIKKPFDKIEVRQAAATMTQKWNLARAADIKYKELEERKDYVEEQVENRTADLDAANKELEEQIAERRKVEESLRVSEEKLLAILESSGDGILVVDGNGAVIHANTRFVKMWRIPADTMETSDSAKLFEFVLDQLENSGAFLEQVEKRYRSEEEDFDTIKFKDNRVFERFSYPLFINREVNGRIWSFRDITKRKHAEARLQETEEYLRQAQKIEALGQLAGGIAHDFNNLLGGIMGYSELLYGRLEGTEEKLASYAKAVVDTSRRAADLTGQLLAFSRKGPIRSEEVEIHKVIGEVVKLLEHTIDRRIELKQKFSAATSNTTGDPSLLYNAILNIAVNARDAMPSGGELNIVTETVTLDEDFCRTRPEGIEPGEYLVVRIADTGIGMDEEIRKHIFEPFFTTKGVGKGTGLGLAAAYGTVKNHNGMIVVHSEPGQGAIFEIYLPLARPDASAKAKDGTRSLVHGKGRILFVDDEQVIRGIAEEILATLGYRVILDENGEDAVKTYLSRQKEIDLVILDVIMPKMNGYQTFYELRKINPDVKVLLASGFSLGAEVQEMLDEGVLGFIQKPFTMRTLSLEVAKAIKFSR